MNDPQKRTWAEIHLDRLEANYHALRAMAPNSRFTGLVKANAYGHGAVAVAHRLERLGADYLAVACLDEALELRECGVSAPILILGNTDPIYTPVLLRHHITQTIYDPALGQAFSDRALDQNERLRCHLKVDTGMSRLGILCNEDGMEQGVDTLASLAQLPGLECEGIFMHFADADSCPEYTQMQYRRFQTALHELKARGITFPIRHCCAGSAVLNYPELALDMIRPGLPLYGCYPDPSTRDKIHLEPVMELKTRIISLRRLPKGTCVSYGRTYALERDSLVAAVPVGYADGLHRTLSGKMEMLVDGHRVPQIGRICMDMCMLDVTDAPEVKMGDVVTVFGDGVPVQTLADTLGTITYELMCAVAPRVPRCYLG
jgi:alanine racemase